MSWYIIKTSVLESAVPTNGVMYYTNSGHWENTPENKKLFLTRDSAIAEIEISRFGGPYMPKGTQILEE